MSRPARRAACSTSWEGVGQPSLTVVCMWRSARPQRGIGVHPNPAGLTIDLLDAAPGHLLLGGWAVEGLMQDYELSLQHVLWRVERLNPKKEVVTKREQGYHRITNAEMVHRINRLAGALKRLGVKPGDRVATLAWNNYRHLELYYAIPCMGAVLHTLNLRLFPEQLEFTIRDADDSVLFVDRTLIPLLDKVAGKIPSVRQIVVLSDGGPLPEHQLGEMLDYETMMAGEPDEFSWP